MAPFRELLLAARTLRRAPTSAAIAVFALGVGIGLSTLIFSIMQGAMLRDLPFEEPDEIVRVFRSDAQRGATFAPTIHDYEAWRESNRTFERMGAYYRGTVNLSGGVDEVPERLRGAFITPSTLELLGIRPALGRLFAAEDDVEGAVPVVLLGWEVWQRRFGGDPGAIGRTVRANGVETVIVGVLPERFAFPESQQVWLPLRMDAGAIPWGTGRWVEVAGRMRDGITMEAATADLSRITARLADEHPDTHEGLTAQARTFTEMGDNERALIYLMLVAVMGVLVIACVNVANLLIGRAILRTKEVGIRMTLGASRLRVAAPFLAESGVLAVGGAVLGIAIAYAGLGVFNRAIGPYQPPFWIYFTINGLVLGFVALAAALAAVLAGVIPAWQAARLGLHDTLKDESRGTTGFRLGRTSRGLVVAEIALSLGLLAGAGLMIRSVLELNTIDLGFPAERVFTARVALPEVDYADAEPQRRFATDLLARLNALPGIESAALAGTVPGFGNYGASTVALEGNEGEGDAAYAISNTVSAGYFTTFGVAPVRGRDFAPSDDAGAPPVVIVNRAFERRYVDAGDAVGRRIRLGGPDAPWLTVIGVVPDLLESGVQNWRPEAIYRPIAQNPQRFLTIAALTPGRPLDLTAAVREQIRALDPDLPLYDVRTLRQGVLDANFTTGIMGGLFAAFGIAALVLATVGLYGVMSFSVDQRRREVGVRMAIGARTNDVLTLVLFQGMRQVAFGLAIGIFLAFALARALESSLFGVSPQDPVTLATTALLLATVAATACVVPALRATRVDPLEALRAE